MLSEKNELEQAIEAKDNTALCSLLNCGLVTTENAREMQDALVAAAMIGEGEAFRLAVHFLATIADTSVDQLEQVLQNFPEKQERVMYVLREINASCILGATTSLDMRNEMQGVIEKIGRIAAHTRTMPTTSQSAKHSIAILTRQAIGIEYPDGPFMGV